MRDLTNYLQSLITEAGIKPPTGMEDQFIEQIEGRLAEFLTLKLATNLSDSDRAVLQSMLMITPETFDIQEFFEDKVENLDQKIDGYLDEFKATFLQNAD